MPLRYSSAGFDPSIILSGLAAPYYYSSAGLNVPRIIFFRPAAPLRYSSAGFAPSIILFGLAAPPNYLSAGFGPLNHLLWANNASELFECGLRSFESFHLG
jgi:hypothetical protein